jgi:PAS domain S-box-containing protein
MNPDNLRRRAEEFLDSTSGDLSAMPDGDVRALIHELRVYQAELEIQNEELRIAQLELASSRDRYADLYEFAPVGYLTLDEHEVIRESNLTFTKMIGIERRRVVGKRLSGFVAPDNRDECFRYVRATMASHAEKSFEVQFEHSAGWRFWGQVKSAPNEPESAWPGGCRITVSDITLTKATERMLQESMKRLALALDAGEMGLWSIDLEKNEAVWNEQLYRLLGYEYPVEVTAETFYQHVYQDDRSRVRKNAERTWETGEEFTDEFRVVWADGTIHWLTGRGRVTRDSTGKPIRMVGINFDVTLQKQSEEALQQVVEARTAELAASERRYRELVDDLNDIVYSMDDNGILLFVSAQVERYGISTDVIVGRHYLDFVAEDDKERAEADFRHTLSTGEVAPMRFRLRKPGKRTVWLEKTGRARRNAAGKIVGVTGVVSDVTERVAAEEEVYRQRESLRILASRLVDAEEEERQRIAAGLHDEVAQVLAACQIKLAQAKLSTDESERNDLLENADRLFDEAAERIHGLVFELSSDTLFEAGWVAAARELCASMSRRYHVALDVTCTPEGMTVPERLRPALYHGLRELIYNVVKNAETDRAKVRIETLVPDERRSATGRTSRSSNTESRSPKVEKRSLRITVRDYGRGFDTASLDEPLSREGGFGLHRLRESMRDVGGRLRIESAPGKGTTATMEVRLGAGRLSPPPGNSERA